MNVPAETETKPANVYAAHRADMRRMAEKLEAAAALNGVKRGQGDPKVSLKHSSLSFLHLAVQKAVQQRGLSLAKASRRVAMESPVRRLRHGDRAADLDVAVPLVGTARLLDRRAFNIRLCGRYAMGVATLTNRDGSQGGERVFHAPCRDRLCPACNARIHAHAAAVYGKLIQDTLTSSGRLFFWTLTVRHEKKHSLKSTRAVLDKSWALLIRRKLWLDTWSERLRVGEVEFTSDNGWHPHFHGLALLDPFSKAAHWPRIDLERRMKEQWADVTAKQGRLSHAVDFRELVPHRRDADGNITHIRYWVRPADRQKMLKAEAKGRVTLFRGGDGHGHEGHLYRVQTLADVVSELTKYVTKRHADGAKPNQVSLWDWTPQQLHEYALGIAGWNLRRASAGWAERLRDFNEQELLAREIEAAKGDGYDYFSWAEIVDDCKRATMTPLTGQELRDFKQTMPRILKALDREGCDLAADEIRGWICQVLAPDSEEPLLPMRVSPWQRSERHAETTSERMAGQGRRGVHARHYRVLLFVDRQQRQGRQLRRLTRRFNMSKQRLESTLYDLTRDGLLEVDDGCLVLSETGAGLLNVMSSRPLRDARPKAEARRQAELFRQSQGEP